MTRIVLRSLAAMVIVLGNPGCESGSDAGSSAPLGTPDVADAPSPVPSSGVPPATGAPAPGDDGIEGSAAPASEVTTTPEGLAPGGVAPVAGGAPAASAGMTPSAGGSEGGGDGETPGDVPAEPTFHAFLLLGQSNMAGYPKAQPADRTEDPRVRVLGFDNCAATGRQTDQWDVAAPPLHECWNDGLGPGDYFAKALLDVIPAGDSIGLVPCAISGERIEAFLKVGGTRYDSIIRRARLAQDAGALIEGILFHQGESNSGDPSWPGKVNTLITDLRTDLGIGDVPFLAGELLYTGVTAGHNSLVNQLPGIVDNAFVISANGLVVDPADTQWNLHFGHDSVVEFGKRYAQTLIEALAW